MSEAPAPHVIIVKQKSSGCLSAIGFIFLAVVGFVIYANVFPSKSPESQTSRFCVVGLMAAQKEGRFQGARNAAGGKYLPKKSTYLCPVKNVDDSISIIQVERLCESYSDPACIRWRTLQP